MNFLRTAIQTLSLVSLLAMTTACEGTFYTSNIKEEGNLSIFTASFDDALPDGLEEMFASCHGALVIGFETEDVDLIGSCAANPTAVTSPEAALLVLGLAGHDPISLDRVFPNSVKNALQDIFHIQGSFPWPLQNCEIYLDLDLEANGLALTDFQANWTTHNGQPALHVDFDHLASVVFAEGDIDGDADCPSAINEPILQPHVPDGFHEIELTGVDVDIWFQFDVSGGEVVASVEADVDIGGVSIDPPLSSMVVSHVGDIETILDDEVGIDLAELADDLGEDLASKLVDTAEELAGVLAGEIPDDYRPTETRLGGGGKFKLKGSKLLPLEPQQSQQLQSVDVRLP